MIFILQNNSQILINQCMAIDIASLTFLNRSFLTIYFYIIDALFSAKARIA